MLVKNIRIFNISSTDLSADNIPHPTMKGIVKTSNQVSLHLKIKSVAKFHHGLINNFDKS